MEEGRGAGGADVGGVIRIEARFVPRNRDNFVES